MVSGVIPLRAMPKSDSADCRRLIVHTVTEVSGIADQLSADLALAGFAERDIFGLRLAIEEALVNGIKHGNRADPSKEVRMQYRITAEQIVVEIEDDGPGFNPEDLPDPCAVENLERCCGRGVFLIRHYMTWVQYSERGNAVTMCKRRTTA
jgi:serine/threonine-protein kinase RsbW